MKVETLWSPELDLMNVVGQPKVDQWREIVWRGEEAWVVDSRRVKGVFTEKMELQEFPFDIQVSRSVGQYVSRSICQ